MTQYTNVYGMYTVLVSIKAGKYRNKKKSIHVYNVYAHNGNHPRKGNNFFLNNYYILYI